MQPQDEMNIDFDDDESPKQPQQLQSNRTATPHNAPMPVSLSSDLSMSAL